MHTLRQILVAIKDPGSRGARPALAKAVQLALRTAKVTTARRHVSIGSAAEVIAQVAASTDSRIVVMGALPRRFVKRMFTASTAERILDALPGDALIVKPRDFPSHTAPSARRSIWLPSPLLPH